MQVSLFYYEQTLDSFSFASMLGDTKITFGYGTWT